MKRFSPVTTLAAVCGLTALGLAWQAKAAEPPSETQAAATDVKAGGSAQLRATIHRTIADLIEARAAEKPDQERIQQLTTRLQQLRQELWAQGPAVGGGPAMGFGPGPGRLRGMGPGRGWGMGRGRGAGMGRGRGLGMGPALGPGMGPGPGLPMGTGRGAGMGRGRGRGQGLRAGWGRGGGPGRGFGLGPAGGPGYRRGWRFIDQDRDGVCDNYERVWGEP